MSFGPGRRCVSMTRGIPISEMTIWSLRESVEVGNWKRYKIGDSEVDARRFRSTICTIILELVENKFYYLAPNLQIVSPPFDAQQIRAQFPIASSLGYLNQVAHNQLMGEFKCFESP